MMQKRSSPASQEISSATWPSPAPAARGQASTSAGKTEADKAEKPKIALKSQNLLITENMQRLDDEVDKLDECLSDAEDFREQSELSPWSQYLSGAPESLSKAQAVAAWRDFNGFQEDADFAFVYTTRNEAGRAIV